MNSYNIAIDFGTCNTVISYNNDNNIMHIMDELNGSILIPSSIFFIKDEIDNVSINNLTINKHYVIGNTAIELNKNDNNYFCQFKRFLGMNSKNDFLENYGKKYDTDEDNVYFYIDTVNGTMKASAVELVKLYFKGLYHLIMNTLLLNGKIDVIITCPAYYNDLQKSQLKQAAENAYFNIYKMYNEPTSAAIYYINNYDETNYDNNKFIVYDLGGGTIDTTVVEYHVNEKTCEIIDVDGINNLGGIDIDNIIIEDIYNRYHIDKNNSKWKHKLKMYAEEIKIKLSYVNNYKVVLENVPININGVIKYMDTLVISYSLNMFNNLIENIIDRMIEPIIRMYEKYMTSNIIFIGGPTQIPLLKNKVYNKLKTDANSIFINKNDVLYKTVVADGACVLHKMLHEKEDFCLLDITPMNIGIASVENKMIIMIQKNSKIPVSVEKIFTTSFDNQRNIDIEIYEGIHDDCINNTLIGTYKIVGIPPLPRGSLLIKIMFKITYNGILNVSIAKINNANNNVDYSLDEKIRIIPKSVVKDLLRKILNEKK